MMKIICKDNHWEVKDGQLILDTPEGQESVKQMIHVLEAQIRGKIYDKICAVDFTANRKQIMSNGLENSLLVVQDICAQIALGNKDAQIS
jgi:hypothetical protein